MRKNPCRNQDANPRPSNSVFLVSGTRPLASRYPLVGVAQTGSQTSLGALAISVKQFEIIP